MYFNETLAIVDGRWVDGKPGSRLVTERVKPVLKETGEGRGTADANGGWGGGVRLGYQTLYQTKLSTLQVSFHQCNFCQQNNRKGKVYQLVSKGTDVSDMEQQKHTAGRRQGKESQTRKYM